MSEEQPRVQFHYKKSAHFRVVHADGAWGGVTPELNLYLSLFSQRPPIPEMVVQPVLPDGTLGEPIDGAGICKSGIVREVEVGVVMNPETLDNVIEWLQQQKTRIAEIQRKRAAREPQE